MDEGIDGQWGGWLMADVALLLVFLLMAGTSIGRVAASEQAETPAPTPGVTASPTPATSPTATPRTTMSATPSSPPAKGLDPRSVQLLTNAGSPADLPTVAAWIADKIREDPQGRRPGMILIFGTAFSGEERTSGQARLAEPIARELAQILEEDAPVLLPYLAIPNADRPNGQVKVDVYFFFPDE